MDHMDHVDHGPYLIDLKKEIWSITLVRVENGTWTNMDHCDAGTDCRLRNGPRHGSSEGCGPHALL